MTLTRVAHKRKVRASNAEACHSGRTFPNHQARCALLIPLRFEFANEFRPRKASERRPPMRPRRARRDPRTLSSRRISAQGLTPNRGDNVASPGRRQTCSRVATRDRCVVLKGRPQKEGDCEKGGAARIRQYSNRPVLWKRLFCQMNLLEALPAGANRVASTRRVTHRVEGGSQPEGPGSSPSWRHALITARRKRPAKYGVPAVIEVSSTGT